MFLLVFAAMLLCGPITTGTFMQETPFFSAPISNVTVRVGHTAQLACLVENLGPYKVAWVQQATRALLSIGLHVLTSNNRVAVQRPSRNTWLLQVTDVTMQDAGRYMCQLSTAPMRKLYGYISVVEPPTITTGEEWVEIDVGGSVTLNCEAGGLPTPTITWTRHDERPIRINASQSVARVVSPTLTLQEARPSTAGRYRCLASNGHPPSATKFIQVGVRFAPLLAGPGEEAFALLGDRYTFRCLFAAHPRPELFILRASALGDQMLTREYFRVVPVYDHSPYTHEMILEMTRLETADFGEYNCLVNNSEGTALSKTILKEAPPLTSSVPPAMDSPLLKAPHLLVHRDNLTVPLLVKSPLSKESPEGEDEDDQSPLESRKRPSEGWTRKIGRINLARKPKEDGCQAVTPSRVALLVCLALSVALLTIGSSPILASTLS